MTTVCASCRGHGVTVVHRPFCKYSEPPKPWQAPECPRCASTVETCASCAGRGVQGSHLPPGAKYSTGASYLDPDDAKSSNARRGRSQDGRCARSGDGQQRGTGKGLDVRQSRTPRGE